MKGDFTRDTFLETHRFTRVLMQQGRVQLDADWNEQTSILLHVLRSLTADVVGRFGGPAGNLGYVVTPNGKGDFSLSTGHYYVDGILCENLPDNYTSSANGLFYTQQKDLPGAALLKAPDTGSGQNYLVYLDVWEQHVTSLVDAEIREVALNGPDTASRARLVTQVKVTSSLPDGDIPGAPTGFPDWLTWLFDTSKGPSRWDQFVNTQQAAVRGMLKARGRQPTSKDTTVCLASPDSHYRGVENQLYRVEIQRGGNAWDEKTGAAGQAGAATFKWSRENGCVVFAVDQLVTSSAVVERAQDDRLGLHVGEWVEVVNDATELSGQPGPLAEVVAITPTDDPTRQLVQLRAPDNVTLPTYEPADQPSHPLLRRWDSRVVTQAMDPQEKKALLEATGGAVLVEEGTWLDLENGVQVWFDPLNAAANEAYRSGDYWLIPARTAIEDVLWPGEPDAPISQPPNGVTHHYAPLAILPVGKTAAGGGAAATLQAPFKTLTDLTAGK